MLKKGMTIIAFFNFFRLSSFFFKELFFELKHNLVEIVGGLFKRCYLVESGHARVHKFL